MAESKNKGILGILGQLDVIVACIVLFLLLCLTFVNVIMRYVMRSPITWAEEMQMFMFLWVVYLAAGAAFRNSSHIAIEILVDSLPAGPKKICEIIAFICSLIIVVYLAIQGNAYYNQMVATGKISTLLRIPYRYAYGVIPIGNLLMIVSLVFYNVKYLFLSGKEEKTE
ncbi:MAG: TRAP transporter small permease [Clostridium sp.]|nr:TRAP transporter small permease [Clostridium sp.]